MSDVERIQIHVDLPYKREPREAPRVGRLLTDGYRIETVQRLTDRDALVTLVRAASRSESSPAG